MLTYDLFNREERSICAHLFRLLHENHDKRMKPLSLFIKKILDVKSESSIGFEDIDSAGIFCEVSLIRDYYYNIKPKSFEFLDSLIEIIMQQENINDCRLYSDLPDHLKDNTKTHPKQIRDKAQKTGVQLSRNEAIVYGSLQGMFNAKPDLVIACNNKIFSIEAKFTESFNVEQLERTEKITEVWSKLLYKELNFQNIPSTMVVKLGSKKFNPDINWSDVHAIAEKTYDSKDRSYIAIHEGLNLLKKMGLE